MARVSKSVSNDALALAPILLSIPQAAQRLGTTISAIRNLIWAGELSFIPLGQRHMIRVADLDQWVAKNMVRNGA